MTRQEADDTRFARLEDFEPTKGEAIIIGIALLCIVAVIVAAGFGAMHMVLA